MIKYAECEDILKRISDSKGDRDFWLNMLINEGKVEPKKMTALEKAREYYNKIYKETNGPLKMTTKLKELYEKAITEAKQIEPDVIEWLKSFDEYSWSWNREYAQKLLKYFGEVIE